MNAENISTYFILMTTFLTIFRPIISEHFLKVSEDFPKVVRRPDKRFRTFFENVRRLPKISEDNRRFLLQTITIMFRSYSNTSKYFLSDYVTIAMVIFSLAKIKRYFHIVKISCLREKAHLMFHWCSSIIVTICFCNKLLFFLLFVPVYSLDNTFFYIFLLPVA